MPVLKTLFTSILFVLLLSSCNKAKILLEINATAKITDFNSVHNLASVHKSDEYTFLTDSAALAHYLSPRETQSVLQGATSKSYRFYKNIAETKQVKIAVLLVAEPTEKDSAYTFQLRTYDNEGKLKESFDFAMWNDTQKIFASATLNEELAIKRIYNGKSQLWQITPDGRFAKVP